MRSKADETLVIVETLICPLQISQVSLIVAHLFSILVGKKSNWLLSNWNKRAWFLQNLVSTILL